jgi:hypothetical protein
MDRSSWMFDCSASGDSNVITFDAIAFAAVRWHVSLPRALRPPVAGILHPASEGGCHAWICHIAISRSRVPFVARRLTRLGECFLVASVPTLSWHGAACDQGSPIIRIPGALHNRAFESPSPVAIRSTYKILIIVGHILVASVAQIAAGGAGRLITQVWRRGANLANLVRVAWVCSGRLRGRVCRRRHRVGANDPCKSASARQ